jgi:hypothetical protein
MALAMGSTLDLSNATQAELDRLAYEYTLSQPTTLEALFTYIRDANQEELKHFADVNIFTLTTLKLRFGLLSLVREYARHLYWGRTYKHEGYGYASRRHSAQAASMARRINRIIANEAA